MGSAVFAIARRDRSEESAGRVVLVSNRLPPPVGCAGGAGAAAPSRESAQPGAGVWIGRSGGSGPDAAFQLLRPPQPDDAVRPPPTDGRLAHLYARYCEGVLRPVLQGRPLHAPPDDEEWLAYHATNRRFAAAVVHDHRIGDRIWVDDYHLMLLPLMLRERLNVPVTFVLRTSFPGPEVFRTIPRARALLRGVLAADRLGFAGEAQAANFLRTATAVGYPLRGAAASPRLRPGAVDRSGRPRPV